MTPVKIVVRNADGSSSECSKLLVFNLKKEAYQRYSILSARMLVDSSAFDNASEIRFYISGKLVHHGLIDSIKTLVNAYVPRLYLAAVSEPDRAGHENRRFNKQPYGRILFPALCRARG